MIHENIQWNLSLIVIALLTIALAGIILKWSGYYRELVENEIASTRFHAIDGLRGYLALGVLLHHIALNYQYYLSGDWGPDPSSLATFLGRGGVGFFFMITSFLFWNKAIDEDGRIDVRRFYISRLRRIVPMYWVAAGLLVLTALVLSGLSLQVPFSRLVRQIFAWLMFTIPGEPDINGVERTKLINTVFWSLVWEWKFYVLLPLLALLVRARHRWAWTLLIVLYIALLTGSSFEWFFVAGCAAATITRGRDMQLIAKSRLAALLAIACIIATINYVPTVYTPLGAALMLIAFIVFATGNTLFGVLACRPARLLGVLSYSLYLLHNWVIFVTSRIFNSYITLSADSQWTYWALAALMAFATVLLATLTYRFVESPYLRSSNAIRAPVDVHSGAREPEAANHKSEAST